MKTFLLSLFCLLTLSINAQIIMSTNSRFDIDYIYNQSNEGKVVTKELINLFPINKIGDVNYLSFVATVNSCFSIDVLEEFNVLVGSRINNIVSLKIPLNELGNIQQFSCIRSLKIAGKIKPFLNKAVFDTHADSVHLGIGLSNSYTGKDVLIGITDWGFDYSSPMFYDTLLQSTRILSAWDQFKTSGPHPSNYSYGTEYNTPSELANAEADTANIYSYATHGSHVAGIAAGSGAGTVYRGHAFESQYLFTTFLVDEGAVLDAWEWMYQKSIDENKRLVINMSWGLYHTGALDGTSVLSQALDAYSSLGVVFVTSGGNNGDVDFHIKKDFLNDTLLTRISFYNSTTLASLWGQSIHAWGESGASFSAGINVLNSSNQLLVESIYYQTTNNTAVDSFLVVPGTVDTIFYNLTMDNSYPTNGRPQMRLRVKKPNPIYKVVLKSAANSGIVHYWNVTELSTDVGNWGMSFTSLGADYTSGDNQYGIGAPACSPRAITVAAHLSNYYTASGTLIGGAPAGFSSFGPMMNEQLKPDISGPGMSVASSISSYTDNSFTQLTSVNFNGRTYPFARFSGTSMSSPAVAGIAALILEANPYLSSAQVKTIIIQTARLDNHTGTIGLDGDVKWGYGKVNAYQAVKMAINTVGVSEVKKELKWNIYPNPTSESFININGLSDEVKSIQIINSLGQVSEVLITGELIDISQLSVGQYWLRVVLNEKVEQKSFIVY